MIGKILNSWLKLLIILAVVGVVILSTVMFIFSFYQILNLCYILINGSLESGEIILKSLKAIDSVLIGVIFFIIGLGLFELFVQPIDQLPDWFKVENIDQLKAMLIKVIIVVMGVSFTGRIVTWDGTKELLGYGIGMGAVILALSYFLNVKLQDK